MVSALLSRCLILVLGTLFPAYRSYKAIKNKDIREHIKWMMYWIVFALFTTLETFSDIFFSWFPFYYEIKILFILWILSPATRGSSLLYKKIVHPLLSSREKEIDELIEKTKQQGYSTFLHLFTSGFQYASNIFVNSAMKGQFFLGNQLKKSLSMNDVYDEKVNCVANSNLENKQNGYFNKKHEPITEEESDNSEFEGDIQTYVSKPSRSNLQNNDNQFGKTRSRSLRKNGSNIQTSIKDYEVIDADILDAKKNTNRRRASAKNLSEATTNYKSNESAHFGTITRNKNQLKLKATSSSTLET